VDAGVPRHDHEIEVLLAETEGRGRSRVKESKRCGHLLAKDLSAIDLDSPNLRGPLE